MKNRVSVRRIGVLLTVRDLAQKLKVSPDWIRARVKSGQIPIVLNMGRHIRFHPDVIEGIFGSQDSGSLKSEEERAGHLGHSKEWRE